MKCENCGNEYAPSGDDNRCPFCGHIPGMKIEPADEVASGADEAKARGNCAWEQRSSWFDLQAIIEMIRNVLVDPVTTFKQMKLSGDMASPLVFVLVLGSIGVIINLFWNILLEGFQYLPFQRDTGEFVISTGMKIVFMVFSPVLVLIGTFISAGILHISLLITGGEKNGFEATFRVVAYSSGATALFQILPICGGFIGGIWAIVAQVIGAREMHETTTGKAVLAVLLPLICCCGCIIVLSMFFGFGAFFIHNATR